MAHISNSLFRQVANECVPGLRRALEELGLEPGDASPSFGMTATIDIDGIPSRVRVQVTLDPDEDENDDD